MNNRGLPLEERTIQFSKNILAFCGNEPKTVRSIPIIDQLVRSAAPIGANYAEAQNAASKSDFRNKAFIAKKEAAEAKYWLTLLEDIASNKSKCAGLLEECHYILMTLQKIINSLNSAGRKVTAI